MNTAASRIQRFRLVQRRARHPSGTASFLTFATGGFAVTRWNAATLFDVHRDMKNSSHKANLSTCFQHGRVGSRSTLVTTCHGLTLFPWSKYSLHETTKNCVLFQSGLRCVCVCISTGRRARDLFNSPIAKRAKKMPRWIWLFMNDKLMYRNTLNSRNQSRVPRRLHDSAEKRLAP